MTSKNNRLMIYTTNFFFYSEDLDELARILVRILPRKMISRIIEKLRHKRSN